MSKLLDRFRYFKQKGETFADGHGQVMHSNRDWEDSYRQRWQFDKIVRSTHGGKSNRPTTRALALTCQIMNLAAARVAQVTPGISTALTA